MTAAGARRSLAHALAGPGGYSCGPLGPGASTGFLGALSGLEAPSKPAVTIGLTRAAHG
jgi:hypothetical protein